MDIDKSTDFVAAHASAYLQALLWTFTSPAVRFEPIYDIDVTSRNDRDLAELHPRIHPRLLVFTFLNLTCGLLLRAANTQSISQLGVGVVLALEVFVVFLWWVLFGTVLHVISVAAGGSGTYTETLSVTLQLISTMYLASGLLMLLVRPGIDRFMPPSLSGEPLVREVIIGRVGTAITIGLFACYLPASLKKLHAFSLQRALAVTVISVVVAVAIGWLLEKCEPRVGRHVFYRRR